MDAFCVNSVKFWKYTFLGVLIFVLFSGVTECMCWNVWKFTSFCIDVCKFTGPGSQIIWCDPNFVSFESWKCWNFMFLMDFWVSYGVMNWNDGAEFCAFLLLEKLEIHRKRWGNTCIQCKILNNSVVHHRHTGCVRTSASLGLSKR